MQRRIAYVGRFDFPLGSAASTRVLNLAKALRASGNQVVIVGQANSNSTELSGTYQGFEWHCIQDKSHGREWQDLLTNGMRIRDKMVEIGDDFDAVIVYGNHSSILIPILRMARRKKMKVIADVVEWHDYSHKFLGSLNPIAWEIHAAMTSVIPACDGVIAISSFLENYYQNKRVPALRVPQLVDITEEKWNLPLAESFDLSCVNLVFAGIPGKKELLGTIIAAVNDLVKAGNPIKLHLLGPTPSQVKKCIDYVPGSFDALFGNNLFTYGFVEQNSVPQFLAKADFSVILRPNARYAEAGFPTKMVESLAAGVPVIANTTGDMKLYLTDEVSGLICETYDRESFANTLMRAIKLNPAKRLEMRKAARKVAEGSLNCYEWAEPIKAFMNEL